MLIEQLGKFSVWKDGSSYYRVKEGKKRIGSFLLLGEAIKYMKQRYEAAAEEGD